MKTKDDITSIIKGILATKWERREGRVVPEATDVKLGNDAVELEGAVLYADLAESTALVNGFKDWFAAEVYKCYLVGACEIIRGAGGSITSFDGDRVMAVFIGDNCCDSAAKSALHIHYLVQDIINPAIQAEYPNTGYVMKQAVGVDYSKLFVARTGIRGANDLVWVGRAANYAAKLCAVRSSSSSFITADVYNRLTNQVKMGGTPPRSMWSKFSWQDRGIVAYESTWHWGL
jgi:class 3 adenylate cyclase